MLVNKDVDEERDVKDNSRFQDFTTRWAVIRIGRMILKKSYPRGRNTRRGRDLEAKVRN